ncbi:hypothetical protein [Angustibacter aerolatus]
MPDTVSRPDADDGLSALRTTATRRVRRRTLGLAVGLPLGALAVYAVLWLAGAVRATWTLAVVAAATAVLVLVELSVILLVRRRRTGSPWGRPAAVLGSDRPTRREVLRAVRRGVLPEHEPARALAVDAARSQVRLRWLVWLYAGVTLLQAVRIPLSHGWFDRGLAVLTALAFGACAVIWWRLLRGARRVLAQVDAP